LFSRKERVSLLFQQIKEFFDRDAAVADHGARAADFAQELYEKGMLGLDPGQLATLKFAMTHHNGGQVSGDPTIGVCWDADRLDLPRVGNTPDSELLSTQYARDLLKEKQ